MMCLFSILLTAGIIWTFLYFRVQLLVWTASIAVALGAWTNWVDTSSPGQTLSWIFFLALFIPIVILPLRRKLISCHIFKLFKSILPTMSSTEQEALEAGTVWWDGDLFSGTPDWNKLLNYPAPILTNEEQAFLDGPVEEFCGMLNDWEITHKEQNLPPEAWQFLKDKGFFGIIIPKKYGGLEFSAIAHSAVVMKVASRSTTAAVTVMVPNSLGPAELLLHYGTKEQQTYYLPRLARGEEIPCFGLTGPEAGSDAGAMPDKGIVCKGEYDGKQDVLGIRLNWEKRYITLGPVATLLGLAFKLYDPDHLIGDDEERGITVALIPTNTPGIEIGRRHFPLNIPFQNGPNKGKDVFIPMDMIIGGVDQVGQGWRMLMESLAAGRSISLPSLSTGAGKLASRATGGYARVRKQFKTPIGLFEGVEERLARIAAYTYRLDAAREMTCGAVDMGEKPSVVSAIAKYNLTENMRTVVNDAMDIQGGAAICLGPRNFIGRIYQAIPISITVEGANILTRSLIIFGQGAIRCHPYVLEEMQAVADHDDEAGLERFDKAFFAHIGFTISNVARALFLGLSGARLVKTPVSGPDRRYYQNLTRMSSAFALLADMSMLTLGGTLKRKEKLSGRLADMLSHLYLASACLKRFDDQSRPPEDLPLLKWACEDSLYSIQQAMDELLRNFPVRLFAVILRALIFPYGKTFKRPSDDLGQQAARILLKPGAARDRLTDGIFMPEDTSEPLGRIDAALEMVTLAGPVERKLNTAIKAGKLKSKSKKARIEEAVSENIITKEQATLVLEADIARMDVITVDDFDPDFKTATDHGQNNINK